MFEKVCPSHPDKVADRIAGALVDFAYKKAKNPKIAVEVLIGHGICHIIAETSVKINKNVVVRIVKRIGGKNMSVDYVEVPQDHILARNQKEEMRCGDNGIFKGMPITEEQKKLTQIAKDIYNKYGKDGKYIINKDKLILCQSYAETAALKKDFPKGTIVNPLGDWTGGTDVDTGATNRKLGSDMGDAVTGSGLHGKDYSKADVSVNIYCHILAQRLQTKVQACCAIGDTKVKVYIKGKEYTRPYWKIVRIAKRYINNIGGFERLAEWGLIR